MKIIQTTIYRCEHCGKIYLRKHHCENHEEMCKKNPENFRACFGCNYLEKRETEAYNSGYSGWCETKVSLCYCKKKEIFVYPSQVEIKGNMPILSDDSTNEPMPKVCSDFK